jgi:dihydroorotate dehydrogenase (fumarate)
LYGRTQLSLAVTGGFHQSSDVIKALLAGADVVHLCSVLLQHGVGRLSEILSELEQWLVEHDYDSIQQLKGSVSQQHAIDPSAYERANYVQVLDNYSSPAGVLR